MRLKIKRDQRENRGFMGGYKGMVFQLACKVELSPSERELVTKYKLDEHPLTFRTVDGRQVPGITVVGLLNGTSQEMGDVTTLLSNEDVIKGACRDFKVLLEVMATFGGEEIIDFDAKSPGVEEPA